MRSQVVVETIDDFISSRKNTSGLNPLGPGTAPQLHCVLNLLKEVPEQLIILSPADYAELVLAKGTIEETLAVWRSRGQRRRHGPADAVTVLRRELVKCPDEYPPTTTAELLFISDDALRDNTRRDPQQCGGRSSARLREM